MLNLAQVQKNPTSGKLELQVLAYQVADRVWEVDNSTTVSLAAEHPLQEGSLVLFDKSSDLIVGNIQPATDWILDLLQEYLTKNAISPEFIATEQNKIEQWRQEITIQNLELNRKVLELETRREQLQELEQSLEQEKERLEILNQKLSQNLDSEG